MNTPTQYDKVLTINVDEQNDFFPGGRLGVTDGDQIIEPMNQINQWTRERGGNVIFTADWHPKNTKHFNTRGGPWPIHCVQHTAGAAFHDGLVIEEEDTIAYKGQSDRDDGYSGWFADLQGGPLYRRGGTSQHDISVLNVREAVLHQTYSPENARVALIVGGLATDYCVKATVLDALEARGRSARLAEDLGVYVVTNAIKAVNIQSEDGMKAIREMIAAGAQPITSFELLAGDVIQVGAN